MHISLFLPIHLLQKSIQQRFQDPSEWMDEDESKQAFTEVDIIPQSGIQLNTHEGTIESYMPLLAAVRLKREGNPLLAGIPMLEKVEMKLTVVFKTALSLTSNWKIKAKSLADYRWDEKPSWGGGFLKLPLSSFLEPILDRELGKVAQKIDEFIEKEVDLEEVLWESWETLQAPIEIEAGWNQKVFLYLNLPREIVRGTDIRLEKGWASMVFSLQFPDKKIYATPGKTPQEPPSLLPQYVREDMLEQKEEIQVKATYTYADLEKILEEIHLDMDPHSHLEFDNSKLRYEQGNLRLASQVRGKYRRIKVNGVISCITTIEWDSSRQEFQLKDFSYHLAKANLALRLAHIVMRKRLQRQLTHLLEGQLNLLWKEIKAAINQNLEKMSLNEYVELTTRELSVGLSEVIFSEKGIEFLLDIQGWPSLEIKKLDF